MLIVVFNRFALLLEAIISVKRSGPRRKFQVTDEDDYWQADTLNRSIFQISALKRGSTWKRNWKMKSPRGAWNFAENAARSELKRITEQPAEQCHLGQRSRPSSQKTQVHHGKFLLTHIFLCPRGGKRPAKIYIKGKLRSAEYAVCKSVRQFFGSLDSQRKWNTCERGRECSTTVKYKANEESRNKVLHNLSTRT